MLMCIKSPRDACCIKLKDGDDVTKIQAKAGLTCPSLKAPTDTFTVPHKTLVPALHAIFYSGSQIKVVVFSNS